MRFIDYLIMRTPTAGRLGAGHAAQPGRTSPSRIIVSIVGLFLGIVASFVVTGITPTVDHSSVSVTTHVAGDNAKGASTRSDASQAPKVQIDLSWQRMRTVGLIGIVICCLTYQGLYFSLRLYEQQPGFLIFFVSFQYGYFWQSVVDGARTVLGS